MARDPEGFRWRTRSQIEEGRSWIWEENGTILFKAEASAWTPAAVQVQQVWVDPAARGKGNAQRGMRDLCRLLLERVPTVCLFVRPENAPAIHVYEAVGMQRHGSVPLVDLLTCGACSALPCSSGSAAGPPSNSPRTHCDIGSHPPKRVMERSPLAGPTKGE